MHCHRGLTDLRRLPARLGPVRQMCHSALVVLRLRRSLRCRAGAGNSRHRDPTALGAAGPVQGAWVPTLRPASSVGRRTPRYGAPDSQRFCWARGDAELPRPAPKRPPESSVRAQRRSAPLFAHADRGTGNAGRETGRIGPCRCQRRARARERRGECACLRTRITRSQHTCCRVQQRAKSVTPKISWPPEASVRITKPRPALP